MTINLRNYEKVDDKKLIAILKSNIPEYFAEEEIQDFEIYLKNRLENYYILEINNEIIGAGGINFDHENKIAKLSWDFLHPNYQNQDFGKQLLKFRINYIIENHTNYEIMVRTSQFSYLFYEKSGFLVTEIRKDYWAKGFDMYKMLYQKK